MTGLVTETCYPDILTGSSMEGGKPGAPRKKDRYDHATATPLGRADGAMSTLLEVLEPHALLIYMRALLQVFRMGVSTPKQPEAVDSSKTFVTWSKRNSTATLFMATLWKMLAKPAVHKRGQLR